MSTKTDTITTPTDLELMLYADGELTGEQLAAVEAHLARDKSARRKLLAMGIVSDVVRDRALGAAAPLAGDIADLVMASLEAEGRPEATPEAKREKDVVAPVVENKVVPLRRRRPANDNMRGLWMVAAVAAAAAAGLLLWSRGPAPTTGGVASGRAPSTAITAPAPTPEAADDEHGVEVAAVDFGALTGSVFYVPSGTATSGTTTVVWLSDDSSGGNQ